MGLAFLNEPVIDENRGTAGGLAGLDIAPPIADHVARFEINAPFCRRLKEQPRLRFATRTTVLIAMPANLDVVERQCLPQLRMHRIDRRARRQAGCDIGLVRRDNRQKSCRLDAPDRFLDAWQETKRFNGPRRVGFTIAHDIRIEDAIAVEENSALRHGVDCIEPGGKVYTKRSILAPSKARQSWPKRAAHVISDFMSRFDDYLQSSLNVLNALRESLDSARIERAVDAISVALMADKPLLICGNGGSAADAMHIAGELVGRYLKDRRALKAIALSADPAVLTAWANDVGYDSVFARQVEALGEAGGVLLAISTSGRSKNVVAAVAAAKAKGMLTVALTGHRGADLGAVVDILLDVPSTETPLIQQAHICIYHHLCAEVERRVTNGERR